MARAERVPIRLHTEEKQEWEAAAARLGYSSVSELVRDAVEKLLDDDDQNDFIPDS